MSTVEIALITMVIVAVVCFFVGVGKAMWHMHRAHQYDKRANEAWERNRE